MDASDLPSVPRSAALALVGSALLVVAAFLPWSVEPGTASHSGFDHGDGYVTFGLAVVVVAVALGRWSARTRASIGLASLVPGYLFAKWFLAIRAEDVSEPAVGLYLTLVAGVLLLASAVYGVVDHTARRGDDPGGAGRDEPVEGERDGSA